MGLMTGNGNIARLRRGASVERRKIVASTVPQASRRSLRFLLVINRFAYFAYFAVPTQAAITALDLLFTAATNSKITKRTQMQTSILPNKSGPIPPVWTPVGWKNEPKLPPT
jgi:hypothetical protein